MEKKLSLEQEKHFENDAIFKVFWLRVEAVAAAAVFVNDDEIFRFGVWF